MHMLTSITMQCADVNIFKQRRKHDLKDFEWRMTETMMLQLELI